MSNAIDTPASELDPLTSLTDFCTLHGLDPDLIPAPRRQDEWERLRETKAGLQDLQPTNQTFRTPELIEGEESGGDTQLITTYLWLCGSFPTHKVRRNTRWSNPNYLHGDEHIEPADSRAYHVEQAMQYPTITRTQVAARFGLTPGSLTNWLHNEGYAFRETQTESKARIGRSVQITAKWSDYTVRDCCRIFPAGERTVRDWVYDFASEFDPPEYPATARW